MGNMSLNDSSAQPTAVEHKVSMSKTSSRSEAVCIVMYHMAITPISIA